MDATLAGYRPVFFAEGDEAVQYLNEIADGGPEAVIDRIVGGPVPETGAIEPVDPDDGDARYARADGVVMVYNLRRCRVWLLKPATAA